MSQKRQIIDVQIAEFIKMKNRLVQLIAILLWSTMDNVQSIAFKV